MDTPTTRDALLRELARLGLSFDDAPSLAGTSAGLTDLLARVQALPIGSTWADIFPDAFPTGDTRPLPYRPLGDYDYQTLPTGPALDLQWPRATPRMFLDQLVQGARSAGWPVYGAGLLPDSANPDWPWLDGMLVLERGTDLEAVFAFAD